MPDVQVTRDSAGRWRVDDQVVIVNLSTSPPSPVDAAVEQVTGRRPVGYARLAGDRGMLRFAPRYR